jgi:ABC-type Zn uptake system ZnuABC Zn-binding protein ZnuA/ABC-type Mn2+/Zn2+ transport system permease subunit
MLEPFRFPFVQRAVAEVLVLSLATGILGTWIVLRGLAFYAHAVGTAAFPGLVLADGLGFAAPIGAFGAALAFAAGMSRLASGHHDDSDSMTALALVGALVTGVILASDVFHSGSNIETLLFGSLFVTGSRDLVLAAVASVFVLGAGLTLGRRWLAFGFDPSSGASLGFRTRWPEAALLVLIAMVVVASLSVVGALLATALLVIPAATARIWCRRLMPWQIASVCLVAIEGTVGLWLSVKTNAPPGPAIATLSGGIFGVAALGHALWRRRPGRVLLVPALLLLCFVGVACTSSSAASSGTPDIVATTTQIGDWVRVVGGSGIQVHQILQPNTDPHDYEPRPADVEATANAAVVFENGDNLDTWMAKVIENAGGSPTVVDLGASVPVKLPGQTSGPEASRYDPHWWHDPTNAEEAVAQIRDVLSKQDPADAKTFRANASAYLAKLKELDKGSAACFAKVPESQRKLVTDHDAFNYYAQHYGIKVVGAVIPSQTTQGEPSAGDLATLVAQIRKEGVKAVFPESSVNPKLAQAIASESGASSNYTLYGDTLGPPGSSGATYLSMEASNADEMVKGFTGGASSCTIPGIS